LFLTKKQDQPTQTEVNEASRSEITLDEAMEHVQRELIENAEPTEDVLKESVGLREIMKSARAGDREASLQLRGIIKDVLVSKSAQVKGYSIVDAAEVIYRKLWGLSVIEEFYRDPEVDEIRVNSPTHVFIQRRGKNEHVDVKFESEQEVRNVIKRMIDEDDFGAHLDSSTPVVETIRRDGSRLTAICPPVSKRWICVLRKPDTFEMTLNNLVRHHTLDEKSWEVLSLLAKGRANILFCGNVGSGKTSLMRKLIGEFYPSLRRLVIGTDLEVKVLDHYPDLDSIELEEHPERGVPMRTLFREALRLSPDCIIVEEFRGAGEALEAIKACTRGHHGSMATGHFNSPREAVEGTAMMMLEEGLTLPLDIAKLRVARAFDVVVQLFGDTVNGVKKLESVTEIETDEQGGIFYRDLVKWVPTGSQYVFDGEWELKNPPSEHLKQKMTRFEVSREDIASVWGGAA